AWNNNSETSEGYSKSVTIDGNPGFETYEKDSKHAALWVMIANRYFLQIELQNEDSKELQEWVKRVDLKKLAIIKCPVAAALRAALLAETTPRCASHSEPATNYFFAASPAI